MKKFLSVFLILIFSSSIALPSVFAEKRTLIATAYYSPLKGQNYYLRGSYEADVRLNGNGTHGASGKAVYAGMIAAPKTYTFGTKIVIPWMGTGTVADRGGAIVKAGERGYAYDRIDIWMGSGEEWLARALAWGKRTVAVEVIEAQTGTLFEVQDRKIDTLKIASLPLSKLPKNSYSLVDSGATLSSSGKLSLSGALTASGKLSATGALISLKTLSASGVVILGKILANTGTITTWKSGATTIEKLDLSVFNKSIDEKSSKADIIALSKIFIALGYLEGKPREAYNPDVRMAVASFQLESGIIFDQKDPNLGVFGKVTAKRLGEKLALKKN